jgi:hypothetical protein
MNVNKSSASKAIALGVVAGAIFYTGYALGIENALDEKNPRFMKAVHRRAKELISKSANDILRERREQRVVDAKFNEITKDQ